MQNCWIHLSSHLHTRGVNGNMNTTYDIDPVKEVRRIREEQAKDLNFDIHAIVQNAIRRQADNSERLVDLRKKKIHS